MHVSHHKRIRSRAGFTLAEVAISATVMLFVITGTLTAITSGMQMFNTSRHIAVATDLITHQINTTRLASWSTLTGWSAEQELSLPTRFSEVASDMTLARTVVQESSDLYRITYTVSWENFLGSTVTRNEDVLIAKNGLNASYGF